MATGNLGLNVLVTAAVQRTSQLGLSPEPSPTDDGRRKRKRVKSVDIAPTSNGNHEDEEDKQRKRRAQIAEASRRSRARRKKEFQDFKEENDQLWSQNMMLRKTLEDLGVHVPPPLIPRIDRGSSTPGAGTSRNNSSDDEDGDTHSVGPSPATSPAAVNLSNQHIMPLTTTAALLQQQSLHFLHPLSGSDPTDAASAIDHASSSPAGYNDFVQFFERRLSWYFTQLKSDAIRSFASHLPYEEKQRIANLQVRLAAKDSTSPALTPNIVAPTAISLRQAAASSAEQAVENDNQVRL